MRLVVNSTNIHSGGGLTLLEELISSLDEKYSGYLLLDARMPLQINIPKTFVVRQYAPTLFGRLRGEWDLKNIIRAGDIILCFGNLPPLFNVKGKIIVFIQNRYLVENICLKEFKFYSRMRIRIERMWLRLRKNCIGKCLVQTKTMQRLVIDRIDIKPEILTFVGICSTNKPSSYASSRDRSKKEFDFIYVASGEPHKNHRLLIKAWELLASEDIRPTLCLTLDRYRYDHLFSWINFRKKNSDLNIICVGEMPHQNLYHLYEKSQALIYPSLFETVGLPLIEAKSMGIPVIAGELDYVRDVVDPDHTFNPSSAQSIACSVKRFLNIDRHAPLFLDGKTFLKNITT
jgi:glycosyltransferase involved in cell wall biosynthesis